MLRVLQLLPVLVGLASAAADLSYHPPPVYGYPAPAPYHAPKYGHYKVPPLVFHVKGW